MFVLLSDGFAGENDDAGQWFYDSLWRFVIGMGLLGAMAILGVIGGLVMVTIRKLHETDSSYAIYFSQCAIGFAIAVVPANAASGGIDFADCLVLALIGVTATAGQLMMTRATSTCRPGWELRWLCSKRRFVTLPAWLYWACFSRPTPLWGLY